MVSVHMGALCGPIHGHDMPMHIRMPVHKNVSVKINHAH